MFYRFLCNLFDITMEIDGNINRLNKYTVDVEWRSWKVLKNKQHVKMQKAPEICPLCMNIR